MKFDVCAKTDQGFVRRRNEDSYLVLKDHRVFVVADGMGGHVSGDEASKLTVDTIREWFEDWPALEENGFEKMKAALGLKTNSEIRLYQAIRAANRRVYFLGQQRDIQRGIGTTVVAGLIHGSTLFVVYSGDSRLYRYRNGRLKQLTEDHSLLNQYLKEHRITTKEAEFFPYKSVILQAVGLSLDCNAEVRRFRVNPGDLYLFCSDGLTDMVKDEEIEEIIRKDMDAPDLNIMCEDLVDSALNAGGLDNITVLVVKILED